MTTHVGTHTDALGHFTKGDVLYIGRKASDTIDDFGLAALGVEHIPVCPTFVRPRGSSASSHGRSSLGWYGQRYSQVWYLLATEGER